MPRLTIHRTKLPRRVAAISAAVLLGVALSGSPVRAQGSGLVGFTEAVEQHVRGTVQLPGTVESHRAGVVAGAAAGIVERMDVQPGSRVARGDVLVQLRDVVYRMQLRAAEGRLQEARARLSQADRTMQRSRELFEDEIVSQEQLDDATSEFTAWQARIDQTSAEIEEIKDSIERSVVRAPYDGVIVDKKTEVGQWIERGAPVVEIVSLSTLEVRIDVPERYFDRIQPGSPVEIGFEALTGYAVQGKIRAVVPTAMRGSRSFPVLVSIQDPEGRVAVGMLASASVPVGEPTRKTLVPKDAIVRQGQSFAVYRIDENETVTSLTVQTGAGVGSWIVVDGIAAGDRVVTHGNERLMPGQTVRAERMEYPTP